MALLNNVILLDLQGDSFACLVIANSVGARPHWVHGAMELETNGAIMHASIVKELPACALVNMT